MNKKNLKQKGKLVIYQGKNGEIKFRGDFVSDTIWGTQKQIANVFDVKRPAITKHINNIFKENELQENSVCSKMEHTAGDGKTYKTKYYNLDAIISIGYRVNSKKATNFRIWATKTLKQHITRGYTINPKIIGKNYDQFMRAVTDVQKLLPDNSNVETENILELIKTFANTWFSLESYDENKFPKKGFTKKDIKIQAKDLYRDIEKLKKQLIKKKQATSLFAQEKKAGNMEGILGNVFQVAFGTKMYPTVEEKAAHLLYFTVKNHPFDDGNKRTGAFTFVWFLKKAGISFQGKITPEALTAITLLVAQSKPKEKNQMIGLILLMLKC